MTNLNKGIILSHLTSILQRCKGYADTKVGELASAVQEVMGDVSSSITSLENGKADKDGAALTGTPTAPTAAEGNNSTQIATTAFVQNALQNYTPYTSMDSDKLGGILHDQYALKTDTAPNSSKLGGVAASEYAKKTDIPTYTMAANDDGNGNVTISIGG